MLRPFQGPVSNGEAAYAIFYQSKYHASGSATGTQYQDIFTLRAEVSAFPQGSQEPWSVRVVPGQPPFSVDNGIDRSGAGGPIVNLVQERNHRFFVRHRDVYPQGVGAAQAVDEFANTPGFDLPGFVGSVQAQIVEGGLLEYRRDRVADGEAYDAHLGGRHGYSSCVRG